MFHVAEHSCGDCKLKCIDCNAQICPKCMVQCPVGNRCKHCTARFTSHVLQIDFWAILRSFVSAFVFGALFAVSQVFFFSAGFYMWFIVYFLGTLVGNLIFKISGRKIGPKIAATVAAGLLAGSLCLSFAASSVFGLVLQHATDAAKQTINTGSVQQIASRSAPDTEKRDAVTSQFNLALNQDTKTLPPSSILAPLFFAASPISFSLIIFILGTVSPFLGWGNPFAGFFRRW